MFKEMIENAKWCFRDNPGKFLVTIGFVLAITVLALASINLLKIF